MSVTAVGAFDAVGSILVVALMVGPAAAAHMLTDRLSHMIGFSLLIAVADAIGGYWLAHVLDASIAGCMASAVGLSFVLALTFAPKPRDACGLCGKRRLQKLTFAAKMLTIHLANHEGTEEEDTENRIDHLEDHLTWNPAFASRIVKFSTQRKLIRRKDDLLMLTSAGREMANEAVVEG